jgi:hypothetical protein
MRHNHSRSPLIAQAVLALGAAVIILTVPGLPLVAQSPDAAAAGPRQSPVSSEIAKAQQAMNELQQELLAKLKAAMDRGGPDAAVEICRTEARLVADAVAKKRGVELGRTSHRLRNPANAPRAWARAVVDGRDGVKASTEELRVVDLGDRVGVLRPIGTTEACTTCHGRENEVRQRIGATLAVAYPGDRATGFAPGDLRGWMWAEVPKGVR